jgi:hypothetical protein
MKTPFLISEPKVGVSYGSARRYTALASEIISSASHARIPLIQILMIQKNGKSIRIIIIYLINVHASSSVPPSFSVY